MKTIKPHSELPWSVECVILAETEYPFLVLENEDRQITEEIYLASDASYIETACNYFPEMLELLKESLENLNMVPNNKYCENYKTCSKISKLLKELEE